MKPRTLIAFILLAIAAAWFCQDRIEAQKTVKPPIAPTMNADGYLSCPSGYNLWRAGYQPRLKPGETMKWVKLSKNPPVSDLPLRHDKNTEPRVRDDPRSLYGCLDSTVEVKQ